MGLGVIVIHDFDFGGCPESLKENLGGSGDNVGVFQKDQAATIATVVWTKIPPPKSVRPERNSLLERHSGLPNVCQENAGHSIVGSCVRFQPKG